MRRIILVISYLILRPFQNKILSINGVVNIYSHSIKEKHCDNMVRVLSSLEKYSCLISIEEFLALKKIDRAFITFSTDDGLESNKLFAKVLNQFGIELTAFVNSAFLGRQNDADAKLAYRIDVGENFLSQLERLENTKFANHGANHREISGLTENELVDEVIEGDLSGSLSSVQFLKIYSWPFGELQHYNVLLPSVLSKLGYVSVPFSAIRGNMKNLHTEYNFIYRDHVRFDWGYMEIMALLYITKLLRSV